MRNIKVKVHPSKSNLKKKDQLAWKIAEIASDKAKLDKDAVDMVLIELLIMHQSLSPLLIEDQLFRQEQWHYHMLEKLALLFLV